MATTVENYWDDKVGFVLDTLYQKGIEINASNRFDGDFVEFRLRRRGVPGMDSWRISNTYLAMVDRNTLLHDLERWATTGNVNANIYSIPEAPAKGGTPIDVWAENWAKKVNR